MRSSGGTKLELDLSVVSRTNFRIAFLASPSFHDGSGSCAWVAAQMLTIWSSNRTAAFLKPNCVVMNVSWPRWKIGRPFRTARCQNEQALVPLRSFARVLGSHFPDLLQDLLEVVARRQLERRVVDVRHELLLPHQLTDGQEVPVIQIRGAWGGEGAPGRQRAFLFR